MKITSFDITNFKGIKSTQISLHENQKITTLIGLNESGKTTVLEAISMFEDPDPHITNLVGEHLNRDSIDLIPKHLSAAFTGPISVKATLQLDPSDIAAIEKYTKEVLKLELDTAALPKKFTTTITRNYTDSIPANRSSSWSIFFNLRKNKGKYKKYDGDPKKNAADLETWRSIVRFIRRKFPKIVYLPTFLFNFPEKIYLSESEKNDSNYLVRVIQEILNKYSSGENLQTHIVERIEKIKEKYAENQEKAIANLILRDLMSSSEKELVDAVARKISSALTKVVYSSWSQILGGDISPDQRVEVTWGVDLDHNCAPYLQLAIVEGDHLFKLSERSLGFRWFFSFLLLTHLTNIEDGAEIIFLLDEPASNLHPKAQTKLLESFERITKNSTSIIYSTHSHYLVNPLWLESAYIIKNTSHEKIPDDDIFSSKKIDIKAIKYKTFVGSHPNKTSYFQPVLDALDVTFSPLVRPERALLVEGKSDFYAIRYFQKILDREDLFMTFPADGSGGMSTLISLFRGWGTDFTVLLDSDSAGQKERARYIEKFHLSNKEIITTQDILNEHGPNEIENFYQEDVQKYIADKMGEPIAKKKQYWLMFYDLLAQQRKVDFPETAPIFDSLFNLIKKPQGN